MFRHGVVRVLFLLGLSLRLHTWRGLAWVVLLVPALVSAQADGFPAPMQLSTSGPLSVSGERAPQAAWPHLRRYVGDNPPLDWTQALQRRDQFVAIEAPHATLGLQAQPVWLYLPLEVASSAAGDWVLQIDYPPLQQVRVHHTQDGRLLQQADLGSLVPLAQRPLLSRSPALQLGLQPGRHDLWIQVQTSGAMVLPITLSPVPVYLGRALDEQMLQGLLTGLALCLLIYSLGQWVTQRDSLFVKYALVVAGSLWFSVHLFGIGGRYLWPGSDWWEIHGAGLAALVAAAGSFLFIEHVLRDAQASRGWRATMWAGAALCGLVALGYVAGLVPTRAVTGFMTLLGPAPALLGLRGAWRRSRLGDPIGPTLLLAWAVYALATAVMIGVIQGLVPVNFWTQHAFQFGATLDMLLFMRVLGLRTQAMRRAAAQATRERDLMSSLAHTDPLTGLLNRRGLNAALQLALPASRTDQLLALYVLDLDGFKPVNDRHGHDVGDELLVAVAQRLRGHTRARDVVARVGGDEFVLLAEALPSEQAAHDMGLKLRDAFDAPFVVQGLPVRIGLTLGYALAPIDGLQPADLLRRADAAMYVGKQAGKHRLVRAEVS